MQVLDRGEVKLINFMGGDEAVVASARVSNGALYEDASKGEDKDFRLIRYLLSHNHGTPFEHSVFTFYVKAPIFVAREWMRHRIASYNEISGRYVEFEPEFYVPDKGRISAQTNKQGSILPENADVSWHIDVRNHIDNASARSYVTYKHLLKDGVAKEMARMVLPVNLYTQFYFTVNARSLLNFLKLRTAEDAQWEIRQYANAIEEVFAEKMPMTYQAWLETSG